MGVVGCPCGQETDGIDNNPQGIRVNATDKEEDADESRHKEEDADEKSEDEEMDNKRFFFFSQ